MSSPKKADKPDKPDKNARPPGQIAISSMFMRKPAPSKPASTHTAPTPSPKKETKKEKPDTGVSEIKIEPPPNKTMTIPKVKDEMESKEESKVKPALTPAAQPKTSPVKAKPEPSTIIAAPAAAPTATTPTRKPTPQKRAHTEIETVTIDDDEEMNDVNEFGGVSVDTQSVDSRSMEESPAKKPKLSVPVSADGGSSEKKKWYPNKPAPTPQNLGSKEIPNAKPNCLTGLTFVLTGTGDSITREDMSDLIKKYGGRVTGSVSGKTDYLLAGTDAGESKLAQAREKKVKMLDEDGFLQMLRDKSKGWVDTAAAAGAAAKPKNVSVAPAIAPAGTPLPKPQMAAALAPKGSETELAIMRSGVQTASNISDMLWVDSHRPLKIDQIIGNPGSVKRIKEWLETWHAQRKERETTKTQKEQDKAIKAMLISGPPGTGKSTAASVIARQLGFEVIEFNASDVRNKKSLEQVVGDITGNRGLTEFFSSGAPKPAAAASASSSSSGLKKPKPNVIIMDEVDGMGGNEDRGGMQELVALIKKTRTPIICIANDATTPKMKTLKNYCENIVWRRTPPIQVAPRVQEICRKEGLEIDKQSLEKLVDSTQGDIRQVINFLQFARQASKSLSFDEVKARIDKSGKDFDLGAFDVVPGLFKPIPATLPGKKNDWIGDRQNMYFVDSDIIPLFIHENYMHARPCIIGLPELASNKSLVSKCRAIPNNGDILMKDVLGMAQLAEAADSISLGDLLSDSMYTEQDYTLMPSHAVLSTIYPAYLVRGGLTGALAFPSALGKQSTRNKNLRIAREFKTALQIDIHADSKDMAMFVLPALRQELLNALVKDDEAGVAYVISQLDHFGLDKDEFDLLMEWGEKFIPEEQRYAEVVESGTKAKLTRLWKSTTHLRKVSHGLKGDVGDVSRGRGAAFKESTDDADDDDENAGEEEGEGEEDDEPKPVAPKAKATKRPAPAAPAGEAKPKKPRAPRKPKAPGAAAGKTKPSKGSDASDDDDF